MVKSASKIVTYPKISLPPTTKLPWGRVRWREGVRDRQGGLQVRHRRVHRDEVPLLRKSLNLTMHSFISAFIRSWNFIWILHLCDSPNTFGRYLAHFCRILTQLEAWNLQTLGEWRWPSWREAEVTKCHEQESILWPLYQSLFRHHTNVAQFLLTDRQTELEEKKSAISSCYQKFLLLCILEHCENFLLFFIIFFLVTCLFMWSRPEPWSPDKLELWTKEIF